MIAMILLLGISLALIIARTASRALLDECKKRGVSTAVHIAEQVTEPLLSMDLLRMKDIVDDPGRGDQDIAYAFILGRDGKPIVHTFTGGFPMDLIRVNDVGDDEPCRIRLITTGSELIYDFAAPIMIGKERIGVVRLGVSQKGIGGAVERLVWSIFIATGVAVVIAAILGAMLARTMTRRIRLLQRSAEEIANGSLDVMTLPMTKTHCRDLLHCDMKDCMSYEDGGHGCWYTVGDLRPFDAGQGAEGDKLTACRACPVYQENRGDEIQNLSECFDIMTMTLKKRMEDLHTLQERMVQSQKLESLGQLAAGVAHELNTPLGIILGYTQLMLQDFSPDSEYHEWLQIQEKHLRICKKIVADLLRFSRSTGTDKRALDLNELLEQVASVVEHTFGLEKIALERRFAPTAPLIVGDREKLQQVFLNLLTNAYDAIGSDGTVTLSTWCDQDKGEALVSVADTGSGIPPQALPRIFDPFFTTKPVGKGTGLGLSVTFGIVEDHGGRIDVESRVRPDGAEAASPDGARGEFGVVFTLHFPIYQPPKAEGPAEARLTP
jgi:signal transduction histidine kinase